jgi:hypothetical protein
MDEAKALTILSTLANGVHPTTGEVFPADSPYQSPEVVRALFLATRSLESRSTPAKPRASLPSNAGKPWADEDDRKLLAEHDRGRTLAELAQSLGRTVAGIQARLEKHGRLQPDPNSSQRRWSNGGRGTSSRPQGTQPGG